jgi:hypothetical protein
MRFRIIVLVLILVWLNNDADACTTFIISGKCTSDGRPILFKNRDTDVMDNALVYFRDGKYDYIGLVNGDGDWSKMVWGGYNSTGFAIINSVAYNKNIGDNTKLKDQEGVLMKMALQNCRTLRDFETLLDTIRKPMGVDANFGVIDGTGGAAYYETGNFHYVKADANDPMTAPDGYLIRTNHAFSGPLNEGFGFCRYNTAAIAMKEAVKSHQLSPQYLFDHFSRNLTHSLTKTNLWDNMPRDTARDFRFFIDYIPRRITSAAVMIVGVANESQAANAVMWTILGFPLTSVATPVWIAGGGELPRTVSIKENLHSALCDAALRMKEDCFPLTRDGGQNYINLAAVINQQKTGYVQVLEPVEDAIFRKAALLGAELNKGLNAKTGIQAYYNWLDSYLDESYIKLFKLKLL